MVWMKLWLAIENIRDKRETDSDDLSQVCRTKTQTYRRKCILFMMLNVILSGSVQQFTSCNNYDNSLLLLPSIQAKKIKHSALFRSHGPMIIYNCTEFIQWCDPCVPVT